jgi:hypothetical protein
MDSAAGTQGEGGGGGEGRWLTHGEGGAGIEGIDGSEPRAAGGCDPSLTGSSTDGNSAVVVAGQGEVCSFLNCSSSSVVTRRRVPETLRDGRKNWGTSSRFFPRLLP